MWGWRGVWIQDKCPPLIGGLMAGGGSDEMGRKIKLGCRREVGRSWERESEVEKLGEGERSREVGRVRAK